jgi:hypothetical protein
MCYENAKAKAEEATRTATLTPAKIKCQLCQGDHLVRRCPEFLGMAKNE